MKKYLILLLIVLATLTACGKKEAEEAEVPETVIEDENTTVIINLVKESSEEQISNIEFCQQDKTIACKVYSNNISDDVRTFSFSMLSDYFSSNIDSKWKDYDYNDFKISYYDNDGKNVLYEYTSSKDNSSSNWHLSDKKNGKEEDVPVE